MKKVILVSLLVCIPAFSSFAECYESSSVFDGRGNYGEGSLCRFGGDDDAPVLPYYQKNKTNYMDYLFSEREQLGMLKSLVVRSKQGNDQFLRQAVNSSTRPLRPFRGSAAPTMSGF
jgi:hypothetical protein